MGKILLVILLLALAVYVVVALLERRRQRPPSPQQVAPEDRDDFLRTVRERAEEQRWGARKVREARAPAPLVTVDPDVFAYDDAAGHSQETFTVASEADGPALAGALARVAARFMRVDETGIEHPDDATALAAHEQGSYTPNYVATPERTERGLQVHVDCKGVISPEMAETMRRILREELQQVGAPVRVSADHA